LPRGETNPEIVERTTDFHHPIAETRFQQTKCVFDNPTAFDTAVDMLDAHPAPGQRPIGRFLLCGEILSTGFLGGHQDVDLREREGEKTEILQQLTPCG